MPSLPARPFDAVVFDFGGVIITPITNKIGWLAERAGVELEDLVEVLMGPLEVSTPDHPWHRAERGEIGVDALQEGVAPYAAARGLELRGDEVAFLFELDFSINRTVVDRIKPLRDEGYRTALLTNSFQAFRKVLERQVDFRLFDVVVDSSEVGCRKPDREIYDTTGARLGVPPERIIFLDDFAPNVIGARDAGWTAIHVVDADAALAELDRALGSPERA
jgi:putative hydrolase of the HAD superfamily